MITDAWTPIIHLYIHSHCQELQLCKKKEEKKKRKQQTHFLLMCLYMSPYWASFLSWFSVKLCMLNIGHKFRCSLAAHSHCDVGFDGGSTVGSPPFQSHLLLLGHLHCQDRKYQTCFSILLKTSSLFLVKTVSD